MTAVARRTSLTVEQRQTLRGYMEYLSGLEEPIRHYPSEATTEPGRLEHMANDVRWKIAELKAAIDAQTKPPRLPSTAFPKLNMRLRGHAVPAYTFATHSPSASGCSSTAATPASVIQRI